MEITIQNERSSFPPIINYTVVYCGPELLRKKSQTQKKKQAILVILVALRVYGGGGVPHVKANCQGQT